MGRITIAFLFVLITLGCAIQEQLPSALIVPEESPGPPEPDQDTQNVEQSSPPQPGPAQETSPPSLPLPEPPQSQILEKSLTGPELIERTLPPPSVVEKASPPAQEPSEKTIPKETVVLLNPALSEDARIIQTRLAELGFYEGPIDGIWGKGSRTALMAFKETSSLGSSDTWDEEVQSFLFREVIQVDQPVPEVSQGPISSGAVLLDPTVSQDAKVIQRRLADLGLYKGAIDGIWGKGSQTGLRSFKQEHSLRNPEQWDKETQMLLFRGSRQ